MKSCDCASATHVHDEGHNEHDQHQLHLRVGNVAQQHLLQLERKRGNFNILTSGRWIIVTLNKEAVEWQEALQIK